MTSVLSEWAAGLSYTMDKEGREMILDSEGAQVMMEWERPYMVACVDALCIDDTCDVLEVGFGCAYSADRIQHHNPRSHTIIECSPVVLKKLLEWAKDKPSVVVVEGTWQKALCELPKYDCIFFDDYPGSGSITAEEIEHSPDPRYAPIYMASSSHFHAFATLCLEFHMKGSGSRLSGYLEQAFSIKREDCKVTSRRIPVKPPSHCKYFIEKTAVVPLITKLPQAASKAEVLEDSCSVTNKRQKTDPVQA